MNLDKAHRLLTHHKASSGTKSKSGSETKSHSVLNLYKKSEERGGRRQLTVSKEAKRYKKKGKQKIGD
jgi:hypothetical protein